MQIHLKCQTNSFSHKYIRKFDFTSFIFSIICWIFFYLKWLMRWILFSLAFPVLFLNSSPHNSQLGLWSLTSMLSWTGKAAKSVISLKSMVTSCGLNLTSFFSRTISRSRNEGINSDNLTWWSCMTRRSKSWWLQIKCLNRDCFFSYLENESVFYRHLTTKHNHK